MIDLPSTGTAAPAFAGGGAERRNPGESRRFPAASAIVAAMALYLLLPNPLILGPRLAVPLLELALFLPLVLANPKRMTKETKPLRLLSIGLVLLIVLANTVALALLVDQLVHSHTKQVGPVAARRRAGLGHQHDRLRVGVLGARPRRARHARPRPAPTAAAG